MAARLLGRLGTLRRRCDSLFHLRKLPLLAKFACPRNLKGGLDPQSPLGAPLVVYCCPITRTFCFVVLFARIRTRTGAMILNISQRNICNVLPRKHTTCAVHFYTAGKRRFKRYPGNVTFSFHELKSTSSKRRGRERAIRKEYPVLLRFKELSTR